MLFALVYSDLNYVVVIQEQRYEESHFSVKLDLDKY